MTENKTILVHKKKQKSAMVFLVSSRSLWKPVTTSTLPFFQSEFWSFQTLGGKEERDNNHWIQINLPSHSVSTEAEPSQNLAVGCVRRWPGLSPGFSISELSMTAGFFH